MSTERTALVKLATEYWRLLKTCERTLADTPTEKVQGPLAQLRYSASRLGPICQEAGLRLIAYENLEYEPNLPVTVSNAEDAADFAKPVIDRTLEPTIMADGEVLAMGKVILREQN